MFWRALVAVLVCWAATAAWCQTSSSYEVQQCAVVAGAGGPELQYSVQSRFWNKHNVTSYMAVVSNPRDYFAVLYPHASPSNSTCAGYMLTTAAAASAGCLYATNAGPFNMVDAANSCLGYIVSDGVVVLDQPTSNAAFGLTLSGQWVIGQLSSGDVLSLDFAQLVSGFNWLVRRGNATDIAAGGEIAPRTAIGTDAQGRLIIFEADGAEKSPTGARGLTMLQTAQWLAELGGYNVINLDGGGSSVTWYDGQMVSKPTCDDVPTVCERPVTTITCVFS